MSVDILFVPDTHGAFVDRKRFKEVVRFAKAEEPRVIVHLGDLFDLWLLSRFPKRELKLMTRKTVREEYKSVQWQLDSLWPYCEEAVMIPGNHCERWAARVTEVPYMDAYLAESYGEPNPLFHFIEAQGWKVARDCKVDLPGGAVAIHGGPTGGSGGMNALNVARKRAQPVVCGHSHKLGLCVSQNYWGLECGHLIDISSPAFAYHGMLKVRASDWAPGFGWLDDKGRPHLESLA